jgi:hypothetical protein
MKILFCETENMELCCRNDKTYQEVVESDPHRNQQNQTMHSLSQVKKMPRLIDAQGKAHFAPVKTEIGDAS